MRGCFVLFRKIKKEKGTNFLLFKKQKLAIFFNKKLDCFQIQGLNSFLKKVKKNEV